MYYTWWIILQSELYEGHAIYLLDKDIANNSEQSSKYVDTC